MLFNLYNVFHAFGRKAKNQDLINLISMFLFTWFLEPIIGETVFWLTGSANYLWTTVFLLYFLIPFRLLIENRVILKNNSINIILFLILGIIAGWTNENAAFISIIAISLILVIEYFRRQINELPGWYYSGLAGQISGFLLLVLAPGNMKRAEYYVNHNLQPSFYNNVYPVYKILFANRFFIWLLIITLILIAYRKIKI